MDYILLTDQRQTQLYQRESAIGIFSSYLKCLDKNTESYSHKYVGLGMGISNQVNSLKVLQLDFFNHFSQPNKQLYGFLSHLFRLNA